MTTEFERYDSIIRSLAGKWDRIIPDSSIYDYDDLVQEGWIAYCVVRDNDLYDPSKGKSFTTFLWYAVNSRLKNIMAYENKSKRKGIKTEYLDVSSGEEQDTERKAMVSEALTAISEVSTDFVKMITDGVPKELLGIARRRSRHRMLNRGFEPINGKIILDKKMIETFFGISIDDIKRLYYSFV